MLGAGFVTRPTLDILCESGIPVTVGMLCLYNIPTHETEIHNLPVLSTKRLTISLAM